MRTVIILNPVAGKKKKLALQNPVGRADVERLLEKYEIEADIWETRKAGDGLLLAKEAVKKKYKLVIAAGGDGTLEETAMGLVGTKTILGVIPLGTFMNMARMLGIPRELEKAIEIIKIGRTRKIDVGNIRELKNNQADGYFFETCGVGLAAELQERMTRLEKGKLGEIWGMIKTVRDFYETRMEVETDEKKLSRWASLVEVSNGPRAGAVLEIAPNAKLNDHYLTVSIFKMGKWELLWLMIRLMRKQKANTNNIERYKSKWVEIRTRRPRMVHVDDRILGVTPIRLEILPNALTVITGFTEPGEREALK